MYSERSALKSRLDELHHAEERIIRQYQEERERIYARLRKLDEEERYLSNSEFNEMTITKETESIVPEQIVPELNVQELIEQTQTELREEYAHLLKDLSTRIIEATEVIDTLTSSKEAEPKRKGKARGRKKNHSDDTTETNLQYEEALNYLKRQTASVQSIDIKKEVEAKTGKEIKNITNFMTRLMKKYPNVQKPYRGQYILVHSSEESEEVPELPTETI